MLFRLPRSARRSLPLGILSVFLLGLLVRDVANRSNRSDRSDRSDSSDSSERHAEEVQIIFQNETSTEKCGTAVIVTSSRLDHRFPWKQDEKCAKFPVSHLIPHCRPPIALASFPGSGNTWIRYLIESAGGIFTGSRYKDLEIQMYGLWGESREWSEGSTIVQKTHDASKELVNEFNGRGILVLRNPYDAIVSAHNFMYAGHYGRAPESNFFRPAWARFVTIQASHWLDMATIWAEYAAPGQLLVLHYENIKEDIVGSMRKALSFLNLPIDEERLQCTLKYKNGFFHRKNSKIPEVVPFSPEIRKEMDDLIDHVNDFLKKKNLQQLPIQYYDYYRKSDSEILRKIIEKNKSFVPVPPSRDEKLHEKEKAKGMKMVLKQYLKWLEADDGAGGATDGKSLMMKQLFKQLKKTSSFETMTGLSETAEGFLTKAVEMIPLIQNSIQKDAIDSAIEEDDASAKPKKSIKALLQR